MKWVSKRLFGAVPKPGDPPSIESVANSPLQGEPALLRRALIAAASETERVQAAEVLGAALAARLEEPQAKDPVEVLVAAICHVVDKALARSWTERLTGDAWLGEVAIRANHSEVRLAAARRVEDSAILERMVEGSRNKDKSVYRHGSELLHQRRQSEKRARRALELSAGLRLLLDQVPIPLSPLLELERELTALGTGKPSPAETEALALLEQARARLQAESLIQRELNTALTAAKLLHGECCGEAWPEPPQREAWRIRLEALNSLQARVPAWLASRSPAQQLAAVAASIAADLDALTVDSERCSAGEEFLASLVAEASPAASAREAWDALPKPRHAAARMLLESRWQQLAAPATAVECASPVTPPETISRTVAGLLDQLESKVAQGNLADAEAMQKELSLTVAGSVLTGATEARLQRVGARLNELRGWARWSSGQAREQLLAKAEELLAGPHKLSDLAEKIPALREEWKRIDAFGPARKDQWLRFDNALTTAYQPVAAHRAEVAARRAQARVAQQTLYAAWEGELAVVVWEQADYPRIEARRGEMLKQWRAATIGIRLDHALRKRFDTLIGDIDRRLAAVRSAEVERCEQLILAAQKLEELTDGARAATLMKQLQEQWTRQRSPLRLDRRVEQKLWLRFRAACDAVFAKRDALRTRQVAQREEQVLARQQILDALAESLAGTDVQAIKHALTRALADLAFGEKNRGGTDPLQKRTHELTQKVQRRIETLLREGCRRHHELLARKAALAEQVEAAAPTAASEVIAAARGAWEQLPKLPGKAEAVLAERFAKASAAVAEKLADGRDARETLLLDLEMALGLPSPAASAEKRRRRQLENLQKRFGGDLRPALEAATVVIDWYAIAALPDAELDQRMAAVLHRLEDQAAAAGR